jgi:putative lipoprotein
MTQIACENLLVNTQESALVQLFASVTGFDIEDGTLTLTGTGNSTLLTYVEGLTDLEGTSWRATGVNNGQGAVSTTDLTPKLTASFGANSAFTGSGVCNQVGGQYRTSGTNGLTIADLESTEQDCGDDGNALESQYLAALGKVTTYEIAGDKLTLRDDGGAAQATFTRTR